MAVPSDDNDLILTPDSKQRAIEIISLVTSAIPYLGGPISNILSGYGTDRKLSRVREVLEYVAIALKGLESQVATQYIKTEDFEEILERALRQSSEERWGEKRRLYAAFLTTDITTPGPDYNEKLDFLRTLEEIQPPHLLVLRAIAADPASHPGLFGSQIQTLRERLPGLTDDAISDLVLRLNDMRVTRLTSLRAMMTPAGAADLRHAITDYGSRFLRYLRGA